MNPLLNTEGLPRFTAIQPEHVVPAIDFLLADNRAQIERLLRQPGMAQCRGRQDAGSDHGAGAYTWDTLIAPIEALDERLNRAWSPVSHLNAVMNSAELRAAYNACLPKLSDYATEMGQNPRLYEAYKQIAEGPEYAKLDGAQKKVIANALRDFRLSGIALAPEQQARYKAIQQELSALTAKFEENVLDATQSWQKHVTDEALLAGLPDTARALAKQTAEQKNLTGWVFTLDYPSYGPVLKYADNRELRSEMYRAYITRASDQGPHAGRWDNAPLMEKLLRLRHELAQLLGYPDFAALSLAKKMAKSGGEVLDFLNDLARRAKPCAERDLRELQQFARERYGARHMEAWDIAYYSEKLRQHLYAVSQEELRPYFPLPRALTGMFTVVQRLYGLSIHEAKNVEVWHPDVRFFEIRDSENNLRGQFYLDPYAREHKRGGAWMDECVARMRTRAGVQTPVAYLTCNFSAPIGDNPDVQGRTNVARGSLLRVPAPATLGRPARHRMPGATSLLTHDEVVTLFHEFGHGLHHMLTRVDHLGVSGINGVAWDAVELPSQFMENWCWGREALDVISGHHQSNAPLPQALLDKMLKARNFQSGMQMVRQLEFALFDFRLHLEFNPNRGARVRELLKEVRDAVAVVRPPEFERFANSFTHIFAGGYAAGYYSYLWAEVLSSDAYAKFEERGIFDAATGAEFLHTVLEQGGTRDALELFVAFRGREPRMDALLRHHGLAA